MRESKFYATLEVADSSKAQEISNALRRLSANAYVSGNKVSVFCIDSGIKILKVKSICYQYMHLQTA
ncbi:hypothetical protein IJG73_02830 [Candidatus Saccharibacteria bacterium]|nr:hypothetical protein [Candidatus Saccharibacteria bacterium]